MGKGSWNRSRGRPACAAAVPPATEVCAWHESNTHGHAVVQSMQPPAGSEAGEWEQQESSGGGGEESSRLGNS